MKPWIFLIMAMVMCFEFTNTFADEPPAWTEFEIKSKNNKYRAEVRLKDKKIAEKLSSFEMQMLPWEITIYEISGISKKKIWSCNYQHDGYDGGILSDDGLVYAYVSFWYYTDLPVVFIYQKDRDIKVFNGQDFAIEPSQLVRSSSHQLWLDQTTFPYNFTMVDDDSLSLEITTIDKRKHVIDVQSGQKIK